MIYEPNPLCDKKTYVRVTEDMFNFIMSWNGKNFSDKFKNLVNYCFHEKDQLKDDIEKLRGDKLYLKNEIQKAKLQYEDMISKCQQMTEAEEKIKNINKLLEEVQGIYEKI